MSQRKIRVGLIGANVARGWGGNIHGPVFTTLPETELVAVCTSRPETAQAAAQKFNARHAFTDYKEMVKLDEIDLVSVSVRVDMHHPMVMAALEAGKPVISEWPLAVDSQQAQEMYDQATQRDLFHSVVLQARYTPAVMYLHDLIAQGYIGQPLVVNMTYFRDSSLVQKTANSMYLLKKGGGGSALAIATGHSVDALLHCFGELDSLCSDVATLIKETTLVDTGERVQVETPDNVAFVGRFKNGAISTVQVSWTADPPIGWHVYAYGTEGCVTLTREKHDADIHFVGIQIHGSRGGQPLQPLPIPDQYNWTPEFAPGTGQFGVAQLVRRALRDFPDDKQMRPNFKDAVRLHRLLEAIVKSSETRSWVKVEPGGPGSD